MTPLVGWSVGAPNKDWTMFILTLKLVKLATKVQTPLAQEESDKDVLCDVEEKGLVAITVLAVYPCGLLVDRARPEGCDQMCTPDDSYHIPVSRYGLGDFKFGHPPKIRYAHMGGA